MRLILVLSALACSCYAVDFIRLQRDDRGWRFVQGDKPFYSLGATTVIPIDVPPGDRPDAGHYDGVAAHGGSEEAWAKATYDNLKKWGLNTLGAWSAPAIIDRSQLYFTQVLSFGWTGNMGNRLMDVFSDVYAAAIEAAALKEVAPLANEPRLLGYFTNNELNWHGQYGWTMDNNDSLLDRYLALPAAAPGRVHLIEWLKTYHHADLAKFRDTFSNDLREWDELKAVTRLLPKRFRIAQQVKYAWAGEVAERYFKLCEDAIRRHDKNHLILGCRFAGSGMIDVIKAQARHCDVISINRYDKNGVPPLQMFDELYALTGKPVLITEFGWRAMENRSGLKNMHGVDVTVATQKERGERLDNFARGLMARPYVLGMHWFQYHDEPTNGRLEGGEDSNYGLVDQHDQPYEEVVSVFTRLAKDLRQATWQRLPFPPKSTRQGWSENEGLALTEGTFTTPVSLLPKSDQRDLLSTATDSAHGARLTIEPGDQGGWKCSFENGTGWGVAPGFELAPGTGFAGAKRLHLRVQAPKGTPMRLLVAETTGRGADGESFGSEILQATGEVQDITLWLEDLVVRPEYGNQKGNRRMDLNGLHSVGIALSQPGQKAELKVLALEMLP